MNRFHFRGLAGYAIHTAMFTGGVTLCLLGLLALGSKQVWFDDSPSHNVHYGNPLYGLVSKSMGIAIVFLVYLAVQLGYMVSLRACRADGSLRWKLGGACFTSSGSKENRVSASCALILGTLSDNAACGMSYEGRCCRSRAVKHVACIRSPRGSPDV